jgi:hypothetical protein
MIGMKEWALVLDSGTESPGIRTVDNAMSARLAASAQAARPDEARSLRR